MTRVVCILALVVRFAVRFVTVLKPGAFVTSVPGCPRCGGSHDAVSAFPLVNPPVDWDYYAFCPTTLQPISIRKVNDVTFGTAVLTPSVLCSLIKCAGSYCEPGQVGTDEE